MMGKVASTTECLCADSVVTCLDDPKNVIIHGTSGTPEGAACEISKIAEWAKEEANIERDGVNIKITYDPSNWTSATCDIEKSLREIQSHPFLAPGPIYMTQENYDRLKYMGLMPWMGKRAKRRQRGRYRAWMGSR